MKSIVVLLSIFVVRWKSFKLFVDLIFFLNIRSKIDFREDYFVVVVVVSSVVVDVLKIFSKC